MILRRGLTLLLLGLLAGLSLSAQPVPGQYVVELAGEPVLGGVSLSALRTPGVGRVESAQRRVRQEQAAWTRRLDADGHRVFGEVHTVLNALFVETGDGQADSLASLPGVRRVYRVRTLRPHLDRAVMRHRLDVAASATGQARLGVGVRIGIIDSGIDVSHPGLQDATPTAAPEGFPRAGTESDLAFTNSKVIVARSYIGLLPRSDPDRSARDHVGHGTAVAMAAAGVAHSSPVGTLAGVAPGAYLGSYKVFGSPGVNDTTTTTAILRAIDDAVADGMQVLNLSLGTESAARLEDDPEARAVERAVAAGVVVVVSAGNHGPGLNTIGSPGTAPSAITVGAVNNDRALAPAVAVGDVGPFRAQPGSGPFRGDVVAGPFRDVGALDGNGLACQLLEAGSLSGRVALVLRGECNFTEKLANVERAGGLGIVVYTSATQPVATMAVGTSALPAVMVSHEDGLTMKRLLAQTPEANGAMRFALTAFAVNPDLLAGFSSKGPGLESSIKPDLVAIGAGLYTATQQADPQGALYRPDGYVVANGTSFSAPLVAGAAAVLRSVRPRLTPAQVKSLLVNTAQPFGGSPRSQLSGSGTLDLLGAVQSSVAVAPVSLGVPTRDHALSSRQPLTLTNLSTDTETYQLQVVPLDAGPTPRLSPASLTLLPGESRDVQVDFAGTSLAAGVYEGQIQVVGSASSTLARVPYWSAVASTTPTEIAVLDAPAEADRGSTLFAGYVRVTDASGLALQSPRPTGEAVSGGGRVVNLTSCDGEVPGAYCLEVRLGSQAGPNLFRIHAGGLTRDVSITGR